MWAIAAEELTISENFFDKPVLDQYGHQLTFYQDLIKDKTVAINFIFTRCTASCPLSTAIFRQVQKKLGKQKIQLITITVDPVNDTPERLLEFSKAYHTEPGWAFVTGDKSTIAELLKSLGAYSADRNQHSNMVIVGNAAAKQWTRLYGFPQAEDVITALNAIAGVKQVK